MVGATLLLAAMTLPAEGPHSAAPMGASALQASGRASVRIERPFRLTAENAETGMLPAGAQRRMARLTDADGIARQARIVIFE
ncbi:hypothetical protein [Sphingomicrobium nitratireducens]|uniref:hypothetical protein n=1 Tax=Sphingomicrobium nitratireducens TaxID=2964666 RepID=UPI00223EE7EF|nr:hypothetical protein [Sphingomicrobium nitratireducens]